MCGGHRSGNTRVDNDRMPYEEGDAVKPATQNQSQNITRTNTTSEERITEQDTAENKGKRDAWQEANDKK